MADDAFALSPINARAALPTDTDYDAICDAFMETSRGRWFLGEYARRNRNADTQMVLDAVARIEEDIARQKLEITRHQSAKAAIDTLPAVLDAIGEARQQIAQGLVQGEDKPAFDLIKGGMDTIRSVTWALRERGVDLQICGLFDDEVSKIMDGYLQLLAAQSLQNAVPGQISAAFDGLLQRVSDMASVPGEDAASVVQGRPTVDHEQNQPGAAAAIEVAPEIEMVAEPAPPAIDAETAFREIYGDEHDIEIIESPIDRPLEAETAPEATDDDDFIQAITDTAQELARLEKLDTITAESLAVASEAPAHVNGASLRSPAPVAEAAPVSSRSARIDDARARFADMAPAPIVMADEIVGQTYAVDAQPAAVDTPPEQHDLMSGTSLGHALLFNGIVRPEGLKSNPMAIFKRMSQAEKIAFMT